MGQDQIYEIKFQKLTQIFVNRVRGLGIDDPKTYHQEPTSEKKGWEPYINKTNIQA